MLVQLKISVSLTMEKVKVGFIAISLQKLKQKCSKSSQKLCYNGELIFNEEKINHVPCYNLLVGFAY